MKICPLSSQINLSANNLVFMIYLAFYTLKSTLNICSSIDPSFSVNYMKYLSLSADYI